MSYWSVRKHLLKDLSEEGHKQCLMWVRTLGRVLLVIVMDQPDAVEGAVPMSVRVCDFDPRKTCLAELGGVEKESEHRGSSSQEN